MQDSDDPRTWAAAASPHALDLTRLAHLSLHAATRAESDRADAALRDKLAAWLRNGDGSALASVLDEAPDGAIYRHLWRMLGLVEADVTTDGLQMALFALPLVVVAGMADGALPGATLPGVLSDPNALAAVLREHHALAGNRNFALSSALAAAEALDVARLPALLASRLPDDAAAFAPADVAPAPIAVAGAHEAVHLRFIVGAALAAPGVDLFAARDVGKWGMPLARLVGAQLAVPGTSVLALPHAPQRIVPALQTGRALQREVSAQVFVSNALRRMRGSTGEPAAVISAHRAPDAPSGGELRLSLSSPFAPRDAEGFRCPLYAVDRIPDVVQMLRTLLADCRVTDVRVLPGVHADRDASTGVPLMFRADALH